MKYVYLFVTLLNFLCVLLNLHLGIVRGEGYYYLAALIWAFATIMWAGLARKSWKRYA
jgi:hypothetical protein